MLIILLLEIRTMEKFTLTGDSQRVQNVYAGDHKGSNYAVPSVRLSATF